MPKESIEEIILYLILNKLNLIDGLKFIGFSMKNKCLKTFIIKLSIISKKNMINATYLNNNMNLMKILDPI